MSESDAAYEAFVAAVHKAADAEDGGPKSFHLTHSFALRAVPSDIKRLRPTLENLHINHNYELAALPPAVGDLLALRWLDVSYNALRELPAEVARLARLERLHCSNNQIESLPLELWALRELEEVRADSNRLRALPTALLFLPKLREVLVENNPLLTKGEVDGAEPATLPLPPPPRTGDCSNCNIRFRSAARFVTFHNVANLRKESEQLPFVHHVCGERCEAQLRARLAAHDARMAEEAAAREAAGSPKKQQQQA